MSSRKYLTPNKVIAALLASAILSGGAWAQERERGPEGFYKEPTCDYDFRIKSSLRIMLEELPTGLQASNAQWDMEIYANKNHTSWTLVAKSKDPAARPRHLCKLASSIDSRFQEEKWFPIYFK